VIAPALNLQEQYLISLVNRMAEMTKGDADISVAYRTSKTIGRTMLSGLPVFWPTDMSKYNSFIIPLYG